MIQRDRTVSAKRVRDLRGRLQLTQEAFARRLNVSLSTVQKWEAGDAMPRTLANRAALIAIEEKR